MTLPHPLISLAVPSLQCCIVSSPRLATILSLISFLPPYISWLAVIVSPPPLSSSDDDASFSPSFPIQSCSDNFAPSLMAAGISPLLPSFPLSLYSPVTISSLPPSPGMQDSLLNSLFFSDLQLSHLPPSLCTRFAITLHPPSFSGLQLYPSLLLPPSLLPSLLRPWLAYSLPSLSLLRPCPPRMWLHPGPCRVCVCLCGGICGG